MTLELKHLAGYLPFGLKVKSIDIFENDPIFTVTIKEGCLRSASIEWVLREHKNWKPILHPLSDLIKEDIISIYGVGNFELELIDIESLIAELIQEIKKGQRLKLSQFEYLFSKHFDIHGLIEKGLAVDINTLENERI